MVRSEISTQFSYFGASHPRNPFHSETEGKFIINPNNLLSLELAKGFVYINMKCLLHLSLVFGWTVYRNTTMVPGSRDVSSTSTATKNA